MPMKLSNLPKASVLLMALVLGVAGCGEHKEKKVATQVAAKVNGSEISVHQVNAVLSKAQGVPPEAVGKLRQEVLDKLIDQQLVYDQAVEKKLDRNPDTMMAVEAARREIIARAYLDQVVAGVAKPSADDIKKYYAAHPDLFARRRVFNLQEILVEPRADILPDLKQAVASAKSLDEVGNWLKEKGLQFRGGAGVRPAEQLPLENLPAIAALKDGQSMLIEGPQNYMIVRVAGSQLAPVDEAAAQPRIQQFLQNQSVQKAVEAEMKKLRGSAKIELTGDFVGGEKAPAPQAAAPQPAKPATANQPNLEKGVAGLK